MAVRAKMVLHCVAGMTMLQTRAPKIPKQMTSWFTLPRVPRRCVGATYTRGVEDLPKCLAVRLTQDSEGKSCMLTSEMYTGVTADVSPMPMPQRNLPARSALAEPAVAHKILPMTKGTADSKKDLRLPNPSAKPLPEVLPMVAPASTMETICRSTLLVAMNYPGQLSGRCTSTAGTHTAPRKPVLPEKPSSADTAS